MIPTNLQYPRFVPDQVLTSDNLGDLFTYLDVQDRATRTNLIGIGIVCGLEVETAQDGTSIKITKGTGVTSEGYLVSLNDTVYTKVSEFDATKEDVYDKFKPIGARSIKLWELKQSAADEKTPLTLTFLNGGGGDDDAKVVMVFVELLRKDNKNCNPESCDDKGLTIEVNLRPLLVRKTDVAFFGLANGIGEVLYKQSFAHLAEMRIQRFDVIRTNVVSMADLFTAYKTILSPKFLKAVDSLLNQSWSEFKTVFTDEYQNSNPIPSLSTAFAFVNNNSITPFELQNLQYFYDHVTDLLSAYAEFREVGMQLPSTCCPDSALFPRHLLLDLAIPEAPVNYSKYRHFFNYSPLFQKRDLYGKLRSLFHRLVVMRNSFKVPVPKSTGDIDTLLRITPSRLDASPLSEKAIPYYYSTSDALYQFWNYEKTQAGGLEKNQSYHGKERDNAPVYIKQPLEFDLEPYNFLRVEGHVGKPFIHVLSNIQRLIDQERLPIAVVALSLGMDASGTDIVSSRYFQEIQLQYEVLRNEMLCCLKKQLPYWANLQVKRPSRDSFIPVQILNGLKFAQVFPQNPPLVGVPIFAQPINSVAAAVTEDQSTLTFNAGPTRAPFFQSVVPTVAQESLASQYLLYQAAGDFNLRLIPDPPPVLDATTITHHALIIMDEITAICVLLGANTVDALDVVGLVAHSKTLSDTITKLGELIDKYLDQQKSYQTIKAYVSPARYAQIDRIADAMGVIDENTTNTLIALLSIMNDTQADEMTQQLQRQKNHSGPQQDILNRLAKQLNIPSPASPPFKDITYVDDPVFKEMKERLRGFACMCGLDAFANMKALLQKLINDLRQVNLFYKYSQKHPGIQHKAGVPMGGTFIVVYHQKGVTSGSTVDPVYQKVSEEVQPGTVVADFYLPYMCCSHESPIVFQIIESPVQPVTPTLSLPVNPRSNTFDFSIGDSTPYPFAHTPDGGTFNNGVETPGVTTQGSDIYFFTPNNVRGLADKEKIDLTFSYSKQGVSSADLKVTVYALPTVTVAVPEDTNITVGQKLSFPSDVRFADQFNWTIIQKGKIIAVASTKNLDSWTGPGEGVFEIQLAVAQSKTGATAFSSPISVTVRKVDEPPKPTLTLQASIQSKTLDFSIGDNHPYPVTHTPDGGTLNNGSVANGVTQDGESYVFQPAKVQGLGDKEKIDLAFSYSKQDVTSAEVKVAVYALPIVSVAGPANRSITVGQSLSFLAEAHFADQFSWTVTDDRGVSNNAGNEQSLESWASAVEGDFKITLTVTQSKTGVQATSEPVQVKVRKVEEQPVRRCGVLKDIVDSFSKLNTIDTARNFNAFTNTILNELGINDFFKNVSDVSAKPVDEQLDFFSPEVLKKIMEWLAALTNTIQSQNAAQKRLRLLALETYRLLVNIIMYASCIQKNDENVDAQATMLVLTELGAAGANARGILAIGDLVPKEKASLAQLGSDINDELKRQKANKDKPKYIGILENLLDVFQKT